MVAETEWIMLELEITDVEQQLPLLSEEIVILHLVKLQGRYVCEVNLSFTDGIYSLVCIQKAILSSCLKNNQQKWAHAP